MKRPTLTLVVELTEYPAGTDNGTINRQLAATLDEAVEVLADRIEQMHPGVALEIASASYSEVYAGGRPRLAVTVVMRKTAQASSPLTVVRG